MIRDRLGGPEVATRQQAHLGGEVECGDDARGPLVGFDGGHVFLLGRCVATKSLTITVVIGLAVP